MQSKINHTQANLFLDFVLTVAFLVLLQPFHTGLLIHEWLGLIMGGAIVIHMLLHWRWIVAITQKLFGKLPAKTCFYYALDAALLVAFFAILVSGMLLSRIALPLLTLRGATGYIVGSIHEHVSYLALALLVVKLALHWKWIAHAVKQYIFRGSRALPHPAGSPSIAPSLTPVTQADFKGQISRRRFLVVGYSAVCIAALAGTYAHFREQKADNAEAATETESSKATEATATQQSTTDTKPVATNATATVTTETEVHSTPAAIPTAVSQHPATRCPHGMVNDPYPGRCHRYTDQNGNNICDLSETT